MKSIAPHFLKEPLVMKKLFWNLTQDNKTIHGIRIDTDKAIFFP